MLTRDDFIWSARQRIAAAFRLTLIIIGDDAGGMLTEAFTGGVIGWWLMPDEMPLSACTTVRAATADR